MGKNLEAIIEKKPNFRTEIAKYFIENGRYKINYDAAKQHKDIKPFLYVGTINFKEIYSDREREGNIERIELRRKELKIKKEEERRLKQEEINERAEFIGRLKFYRSIIRDSLDVFGYKVQLAIRLKEAVDKGDKKEVEELKKKIDLIGEVKIDNFDEARMMLELYRDIVNQLEEKLNKN